MHRQLLHTWLAQVQLRLPGLKINLLWCGRWLAVLLAFRGFTVSVRLPCVGQSWWLLGSECCGCVLDEAFVLGARC